MKVIGFKRADFMSKEGAPITGYNLYLSYPITGEDADGSACERYYMTDAKLARSGYKPPGNPSAVPPPPVDTEGKNPSVRVDWGILCCQAEKYQENFQKIMNNL